jgi:hypothetical protein
MWEEPSLRKMKNCFRSSAIVKEFSFLSRFWFVEREAWASREQKDARFDRESE